MFLRHTPLLEVNQANISLVVLDTYKSKLWDSKIKDKTKHFWLLTFKCEIILMLVTSSRKIYNWKKKTSRVDNQYYDRTFFCPSEKWTNQIGMFLRHTPLLEVNQANISLVVLDTCNQNFETLKSKTRQTHLCLLTFKCEIIFDVSDI